MSKRFDLGTVVVTAGVDKSRKHSPDFSKFVSDSLLRYINGDWGDLCEDDCKLNDASAESDGMIFAAYIHPDGVTTIYIQTEWDRSYTTIMFPHER